MADSPQYASDYAPEEVELARRTALTLATRVGDLLQNDLVVVGGLVPALLIPPAALRAGVTPHIGTMDVDIGLEIGLLDQERYKELTKRLRDAHFEPDRNDAGNPTRQRWKHASGTGVTVDFLIEPTAKGELPGKLKNIEADFAAFMAEGISLAFLDKQLVRVDGKTLEDETASRDIPVCGAGAFVILKSRACRLRGKDKDAYDLAFMLRHHPEDVAGIAARIAPLLAHPSAQQAIEWLFKDFAAIDGTGPSRASRFLYKSIDDNYRAEITADVLELRRLLRA